LYCTLLKKKPMNSTTPPLEKELTFDQQLTGLDRQIKLQRKYTELMKLEAEMYQYKAMRIQAILSLSQMQAKPKADPQPLEPVAETAVAQTLTVVE
jgi:predicted nucleotidyltransferase